MENPSQHCTVGAYWSFYLLTGVSEKTAVLEHENVRIGSGGVKKLDTFSFEDGFFPADGVYWARACHGNKKGKNPIDNLVLVCPHTFVMTIGDNGVTVYQTVQAAFPMKSEDGIKTYNQEEFADKVIKATSKQSYGPKGESVDLSFDELFGFKPEEEDFPYDINKKGPPQIVINGPVPNACADAPTLASFEFPKGSPNWGIGNVGENLPVNWPITKVHSANTMGHDGAPNGGWMKGFFCNCYGTN